MVRRVQVVTNFVAHSTTVPLSLWGMNFTGSSATKIDGCTVLPSSCSSDRSPVVLDFLERQGSGEHSLRVRADGSDQQYAVLSVHSTCWELQSTSLPQLQWPHPCRCEFSLHKLSRTCGQNKWVSSNYFKLAISLRAKTGEWKQTFWNVSVIRHCQRNLNFFFWPRPSTKVMLSCRRVYSLVCSMNSTFSFMVTMHLLALELH